ncbi:MAG: ATP-binding protein [Verrucomicrobiota bacterium]|nr:ATP-binding protein [Verrucomicrobiota bacterium]
MPPIGVTIPHPIYGQAAPVYAIYFVVAVLVVIAKALRDLRTTSAGDHAELAIVLVGSALAIALPLVLKFALGYFLDPEVLLWTAPFRVVFFGAAVGYAIATRKVMDVGSFLRRVIGYSLLTGYLLVLYATVWWLSDFFAEQLTGEHRSIPHVVAALAIAFAMAPARGLSQTLASRLFVGGRSLDFRATVNHTAAILRSVTTLQDLLERFAKTIGEALGTDRVLILLDSRRGIAQAYPPRNLTTESAAIDLPRDSCLAQILRVQPEALVAHELRRIRASDDLDDVLAEMTRVGAAVALPIFAREHLEGIMLLGPRLSGRIYGSVEQNALQVLCGQLAVAVENAQLFTEVQNARIYNETLLQNLTTGVIAVDAEGRITVFNKEAEQITDRPWHDLVDRSMDDLPEQLLEILQETLRSGELQEHREVMLRSGDKSVVVRASSSIFHDESGQMLGALMVLTDITAMKRLERQIRRSDRLASLGTLSAGMAHEIKNPLVSIKTFAQLLPERYQDSDFRETFSNLIGHEIDRIDSLVNQLLRFARPAKPLLKPMHVHAVLEKSLMLVGHRLYQKEIKLSRSWSAEVDTIRADADQLEQVFLNFFLNAMDAMTHGGELTVATEIRSSDDWAGGFDPLNSLHGKSHEVLRITVRDDGEGIRGEDIPHVFDPFFTTKDYGTGLGLSVVHGIIQEHGGQIEVESELARGTAFYILLPLVRFEEEVAAA